MNKELPYIEQKSDGKPEAFDYPTAITDIRMHVDKKLEEINKKLDTATVRKMKKDGSMSVDPTMYKGSLGIVLMLLKYKSLLKNEYKELSSSDFLLARS
jgi:hypothetical protein